MNDPATARTVEHGRYRRFMATVCAAVTAAALIVVITGGRGDDNPSPVAAPEAAAASASPADAGAYIPPGGPAADPSYSPSAVAAPTSPPASTGNQRSMGNQGGITNPADVGAPTNITKVSPVNGRFPYTLATVNRASPEQVAWAYTTLRYTVTWNDADSQQATTRAATYTTPTAPIRTGTSPPAQWQATAAAQWQQAVKAHVLSTVHVTALTVHLGVATPGGFTLVNVSWVTTTTRNDQPTVTVPGTSTLNLAAQTDGTWLVAGTGADQPG